MVRHEAETTPPPNRQLAVACPCPRTRRRAFFGYHPSQKGQSTMTECMIRSCNSRRSGLGGGLLLGCFPSVDSSAGPGQATSRGRQLLPGQA